MSRAGERKAVQTPSQSVSQSGIWTCWEPDGIQFGSSQLAPPRLVFATNVAILSYCLTGPTSHRSSKQASKQANKQTNKRAIKQTSRGKAKDDGNAKDDDDDDYDFEQNASSR